MGLLIRRPINAQTIRVCAETSPNVLERITHEMPVWGLDHLRAPAHNAGQLERCDVRCGSVAREGVPGGVRPRQSRRAAACPG